MTQLQEKRRRVHCRQCRNPGLWFAMSAIVFSCVGCASMIGYRLGADRDARDWKTLTRPWDTKLSGLNGKSLHLRMKSGDGVYCVVDSVLADGTAIAVHPRGWTSAAAFGGGPQEREIAIGEIESIEVGPDRQKYTTLGLGVGVVMDLAGVYLATRGLEAAAR